MPNFVRQVVLDSVAIAEVQGLADAQSVRQRETVISVFGFALVMLFSLVV